MRGKNLLIQLRRHWPVTLARHIYDGGLACCWLRLSLMIHNGEGAFRTGRSGSLAQVRI